MTPCIRPRDWAIAAALSAAAALGGCGKMGELDRPGPLFGKPSPASAAQGAEQQGEQPQQRSSRAAPTIQTIDPRDITMNPMVPPRSNPLPGQSSDPFRQPPPSALPDPYANPQ